MTNKINQNKQDFLLKPVLIILFASVWLLLLWFSSDAKQPYRVFIWVFCYLALLILVSLFKKNRIVRQVYFLLSIPSNIILATGPFVQIIGSLLYAYITILGAAAILVFILPKEVFGYHIEVAAGIYLVLTISSIFATTLSERLIKSWHYAQNREYKEFNEKVSLKLFGHSKIRVIIFAIYFILLIVFTVSTLIKQPIFKVANIDMAILQSFATYVAYDRLISNWSVFKPRDTE